MTEEAARTSAKQTASTAQSAEAALASGRRVTDLALKALKERPKFSIRMQIYLTVLLSLVIFLGIAAALLVTNHIIENRVKLLEISNSYLFEIQQARRFEKNYFLYGTNLRDALDNVYTAKRILLENSDRFEGVIDRNSSTAMLAHLEQYERLLEKLEDIERKPEAEDFYWKKKDSEVEVRKHGQEMVSFAQNLTQKERAGLDNMIIFSRRMHIYSFLFLFLLFVFNTVVLGWRMISPLRRFLTYADRIAGGDYSPIMPARRYRDEFSTLAIAINHMISELERRQDILVQSHKLRAIGTLTAGVAHELNNPINNISLTAHMLKEDYTTLSDPQKLEMIDDLLNELDRTKRIVRSLLDFARESESIIEPLDLNDVIRETLGLAGNQISLAGIHVDLQIMPHLPRIHGDRQQIEQVFLNLILNAIDVTPKGGRLQILVIPDDEPNYVAVKVTDYGPGIPDHVLSSIFDPFFTTKSKGTGLGLSICQGIIAKHGGNIQVKTRMNEGTTFTVRLPITTFPANLDRVKS
ncbi:MAG: HAMP domain-containing protein [Candidatus Abyssobacteria bacterium SURF_5]|uniref:histidine kinase n=1 Tax=Abyssobacteria bacterium (strain SURF_5) TaxID=2093360 RepID=A0A3A4NP63_ABYX5|nr:MAG: HAMP domain-containing protein [Candidatus Abyssubacteria bacterium SURF_5]